MTRKTIFILAFIPMFLTAAWQREVLDWGIIGGSAVGGGVCVLSYPVFEKPLIGGPGDKPYKEDQIPNSWVLAGGLVGVGLASLLPNQDGWFNERSYRHLKGGLQALTVGFFVKDLAKILIGRPRPDYYDRMQQGIEVKKARKSFPSGHATHAFTTATYLGLYTWDEWQSESPWALVAKSGITALLAGAAGYVAYSRVVDNRHYPGDIIAGSILGAGTALFFYSYQHWWGNPEDGSEALTQSANLPPITIPLVSVRF